ncbi:cell division protein ZapA [Consotaella aegiceratis]|uniref:cell division protein ZapA n=1 Tax=Consotaella aegiceratis TaxID=3097961 RepID=UPI002F40BB29
MPQVVVTIDGKTYRMACAEGEEEHLAELARDVDGRIAELRTGFGEIGDQRLTVMAAIMAVDELSEIRGRMADLEERLAAAQAASGSPENRADTDAEIARQLNDAAASIERIAGKLASVGD